MAIFLSQKMSGHTSVKFSRTIIMKIFIALILQFSIMDTSFNAYPGQAKVVKMRLYGDVKQAMLKALKDYVPNCENITDEEIIACCTMANNFADYFTQKYVKPTLHRNEGPVPLEIVNLCQEDVPESGTFDSIEAPDH